jgi:hypothetical protein
MADDSMTDEESRHFWTVQRKRFGTTIPKAIKEVCEIALIGGALQVAYRFSESPLLIGLYWCLLIGFAFRIAARIAFPKAYNSPVKPVLIGVLATIVITAVEDRAIRSAANAALIQVQSDKAAKLLAAQAVREKEGARIHNAWVKNSCFDDEGYAFGKYNYKLCGKLAYERELNKRRTDALLKP